jgi:glucokinase
VTGLTVFQAAGEGDPTACELFDRLGFWLGVGIASLTSIFDLDVVVIGGGLLAAGDLLLRPARASLERFAFAPTYRELPRSCRPGLVRRRHDRRRQPRPAAGS